MPKLLFRKVLFLLIILSLITVGLYAAWHYVSSLPKPVYTLTVTDNTTHHEVFTASGTDEITIEEQSENYIKFLYRNKDYAFSNCSVKASDNVSTECQNHELFIQFMILALIIVIFVCTLFVCFHR
jgi:hypothetical protein